MGLSRQNRRGLALAVGLCVVGMCVLSAGRVATAADGDAAKLVPDNTVVYVLVQDATALQDKFKQTNIYALYKDPAMQPFIGPAEKKITEKIEEGLTAAWAELGMEKGPDKLPWPQGRILFAMRMGMRTRKVPVFKADADKPVLEDRKEPEPEFLVLGDMGKNLDLAKELVKKMADKAVEKGRRRQKETIRGVEVEILSPPSAKEGAKPEEAIGSSEPPVCIAFKDSTIMVSSNLEFLKDVLARMTAGDLASLADDPGLQMVRKSLGAGGDLVVYFNAKALMDFLKANAEADEKEEMVKIIRTLGFENVAGLALVLDMAPNKVTDLRMRCQVAIRGERTGIPAILTPLTAPTKPGKLLTKGLASALVAHYDIAKVYEQIAKIVEAMTGEAIDKSLEGMMEATKGPGEGGRPAVNLKTEVIGQLTAPITLVTQVTKPFTAPDSQQILVAIGVRDGKVLDGALARIHETFLAQGNKELRRELHNTNIYLLPGMPGLFFFGGPFGGEAEEAPASKMAFAVAGDQLVFGPVKRVEQHIRDLAGGQAESITADPMYQHAAGHLPAQAGVVIYENQQLAMEHVWAVVKELAKQAARQPAAGKAPRAVPPDDFQVALEPVQPQIGSSNMALAMIIQQLREFCDFTALPEYAAVRKHFGASITHVVSNEQGIYVESLSLKPPAAVEPRP